MHLHGVCSTSTTSNVPVVFVLTTDNSSRYFSSPMLSSLSAGRGLADGSSDITDMNKKDPNFGDVIKGLPFNMSALHFCVPNEPKYKIVVAVVLVLLGKEIRLRSRSHSHSGSSIIEMMYSLLSEHPSMTMMTEKLKEAF